jgi:hypothetical protein
MTTLAANNQTVLKSKPVEKTSGGVKIPIVIQSDTVIGTCPTITVQALNSEGRILAERTANTEFGFDLSVDFVDCTSGVQIEIPSGYNPIRFRALDDNGATLAEGGLISFSELSDPVSEGNPTPSLSGVEKSLSGILISVVGLIIAFQYIVE